MLLFTEILEYGILAINEFLCKCSFIQSRQCLFALEVRPFPKSMQWEKPTKHTQEELN